jgi:hypothetical protein
MVPEPLFDEPTTGVLRLGDVLLNNTVGLACTVADIGAGWVVSSSIPFPLKSFERA